MGKTLLDLRPVYVVGIGLHRYQRLSDKTYVELGLTAVREALNDCEITDIWSSRTAAPHPRTCSLFPGREARRPRPRHYNCDCSCRWP